jgi:general secretion pathway protein D
MIRKIIFLGVGIALLSSCARIVPKPPEPSPGHLRAEQAPPRGEIPRIVDETPFLPPPEPEADMEKYTVVVHEVPVKELLFAVARDANMNVDVDPRIEGRVTINAVNQTLPQILDRVSRQVDIRYELRDKTIIVSPDEPYFHTYKVDYVNMSRDSTSTSSVATQISTASGANVGAQGGGGGGGSTGGGNNSTTDVKSTSNHRFWQTLTQNIMAIIGEQPTGGASPGQISMSKNVVVNPESGIINVQATSKQHEQIRAFIDSVLVNVQRQALIEVTVVEVTLNDLYQTGVDWNKIAGEFSVSQAITTGLGASSLTTGSQLFQFAFKDDKNKLNVTLKALEQYGNTRVLSSPKLMVLNNQTSMLKVVDNLVYFTIQQQVSQGQFGGGNLVTSTTTPHTVPVGFVMTVTPQIDENDQVTLNVRPTISRLQKTVPDPNPALRFAPDGTPLPKDLVVSNELPQIQVREMESVLKVTSGQIAVLGGLMQDDVKRNTGGIPFASNLPVVGDLFRSRDNTATKTELVIFLRPTVIRNASIDSDLQDYRPYLDDNRYQQFTPRAK